MSINIPQDSNNKPSIEKLEQSINKLEQSTAFFKKTYNGRFFKALKHNTKILGMQIKTLFGITNEYTNLLRWKMDKRKVHEKRTVNKY